MTSALNWPPPTLAQPWEWIILLIIVAVLLLFGPSKLPEFARSIGRAMGEFRKGKAQVEREIREEWTREEVEESSASREQVLKAAKELALPTEGRDLKELRREIARKIDSVESTKVVTVAKSFGLQVEAVSAETLKEQIIRRLKV